MGTLMYFLKELRKKIKAIAIGEASKETLPI
jgi:hypothetical protein